MPENSGRELYQFFRNNIEPNEYFLFIYIYIIQPPGVRILCFWTSPKKPQSILVCSLMPKRYYKFYKLISPQRGSVLSNLLHCTSNSPMNVTAYMCVFQLYLSVAFIKSLTSKGKTMLTDCSSTDTQ